MRVRKTTFEESIDERERAFLNLSGEERLTLARYWNEYLRKFQPNHFHLLKLLNEEEVKYVVVGEWAISYYRV